MYKEKIVSSLFDEMCDGCKFKMSGAEKGCVKFSHTRTEIDNGVYVFFNSGASHRLTESTPCSAKQLKD